MIETIKKIRAKAEKEMLVAQAKVEFADELVELFAEAQPTIDADTEQTIDTEFGAI